MSSLLLKRNSGDDLVKNPKFILEGFIKSGLAERIKENQIVGIKIHFGEKGNKSYVNPIFLSTLVKFLKRKKCKVFIFDTNTLYKGKRMNAVDHIQLAVSHGFSRLNIPILIGDGIKGNDYFEIEINKKHFSHCYIASLIKDIDFLLVVSHFTGHMLTGFGAAIKNLGMGCASRRGKMQQHCEISPFIKESLCIRCGLCASNCPAGAISFIHEEKRYFISHDKCIGCAQCVSVCASSAVSISWSENYNLIMERMVEYAYAVVKIKECGYINFCTYITKECDCMNKEEKGIVDDLGILFGDDPLAIDKASVDLLIEANKHDFLKELYPQIDYQHQFQYAYEIGLGALDYSLDTF